MESQQASRVFKCVPIDNAWTLPGTKLDLKAIYRRPRRRTGEYGEIIHERDASGRPLYDTTSALPMRRHADWMAKGFDYVTVVSTPTDPQTGWPVVAASLRARGFNPQDFLQHPQLGTWNPKLYLATAEQIDQAKWSELRTMVEQFGSEAVLAIRQQSEPHFTLPAELQGIPPGGRVLDPAVPSDTKPGEITDRTGYEAAKAAGRIAEIPPTKRGGRKKADEVPA